MQRLTKFSSAIPAAAILAVLFLSLARPALSDTKPKFVYVANSGDSYAGDPLAIYQLSATATCANYPCASTLSISGSVTLDLGTGKVAYGTLYLTDSSDLASSPVALTSTFQPIYPPTAPDTIPLYFNTAGYYGGQSTSTNLTLYLPFTVFPPSYSGGPLCTSTSTPSCVGVSSFSIQAANMSPTLEAETGGAAVTGTIVSGSLTLTPNTQGSDTVSGYAIDATTGALNPIPGSPFTVGTNPHAVAIDPASKFLYVANRVSNNISAFSVNASTGALTQIPGSPFAAGSEPDSFAISPKGKFLYVANELSANIWAYSIDTETGALTPINGSPFEAGQIPTSLTMDPLGRFLYVSGFDSTFLNLDFLGFTIDSATGILTPIPAGNLDVNPSIYDIGTAEDPSGKFLFGVGRDFNVHWGVGVANIDSGTGGLAPGYGDGLDFTSAVAVHPSGKFLYTADDRSDYVTAYTVDPSTGNLALIPGTPYGDECGHVSTCNPMGPYSGPYATGQAPESLLLDPSGQFAYVGNMGSNNVSAYTINATTGALAPVPGSPFMTGVGPASIAIASFTTVPFNIFKAKLDIDEDRKTTFRLGGFFTLGPGTDGIYPLSETVTLQVGSLTVAIPAGSFQQKDKHEFVYEGQINGVDVKMVLFGIFGNDYFFAAEGKGDILAGIANPVTVGLAIGDDEGSANLTADIDK